MTRTSAETADILDDAHDGRVGHGHLGLIAALAVVALIAVGGTAALAVQHTRTHRTVTAATPAPDVSTAEEDSAATGFAVPQTDVFGRRVDIPHNPAGQPLPQTVAPHVQADPAWLTASPVLPVQGGWQKVAGASVPFSVSDGPTHLVDGVAAGWAHTPQGAALAAVYTGFEVNARPGDRAVREHLIENSPGALAAFDADKAAGKIPSRLRDSATRYLVAPDAYKIDSYNDDMAVAEIATRSTDDTGAPVWLSTQLVTVWDGGDWRLQPPPGGTPPQHTVSSLTGWVTW